MATRKFTRHGLWRTPEYNIFHMMHQRCENPKAANFHRYGGRGIKVCRRWQSVVTFYSDMGPRPSSRHKLERKNNKRSNCLLKFHGETKTAKTWARLYNVKYITFMSRLYRHWSIEKALSSLDHRKRVSSS